MKEGVVSDGRTTTYYGNAANLVMAQMSMQYTNSQEEAEEKILKAGGVYQLALMEVAPKYGFTITDELKAQVEKKQAEYKAQEEAFRIDAIKKKLGARPVKVAKRLLSQNCVLCKQPITPLQGYHDGTKAKAHSVCVSNPRTGT